MPNNLLRITVNGVDFENPFIVGSGPPTTHAGVISQAFELGWGGVAAKTISLDHSKVTNVIPRYGKIRAKGNGQVIGFENIELISNRPFETWLEEFRQLKKKYPTKIIIASIMEEFSKQRWQEIVTRVQETGVDILELNLSCPHGLPERRMGMAMGEDPKLVEEVVSWVNEVATIPVWVKTTPNVGDVTQAARAAVKAGAKGISAINTILSVIGVDLRTLRPMPSVAGYSEPGGYSGIAVRPIALRQVMEISRSLPGTPVCGIGGIETGEDAAQFMLLGASTVQVCTGVMLNGYKMIGSLKSELEKFLNEHAFHSLSEVVGRSLPYFTSHANLVERLASEQKKSNSSPDKDDHWTADIAQDTNARTFEK